MTIKTYSDTDCLEMSKLFYETVHNVNKRDYTEEQLAAWGERPDCLLKKRSAFKEQKTLLAEVDGKLAGFGSIDKDGYLDFLFVHKDWQRKGVATLLCDELESRFGVIKTHASITAKPFFEGRGYKVLCEQEVVRNGIKLKRFEMCKRIKIN